jgi:hypothetical protein
MSRNELYGDDVLLVNLWHFALGLISFANDNCRLYILAIETQMFPYILLLFCLYCRSFVCVSIRE